MKLCDAKVLVQPNYYCVQHSSTTVTITSHMTIRPSHETSAGTSLQCRGRGYKMIFGRLQPLPLNLFLCALGAHPRDGTGKMTSFTYFFASNSKSIQTLRTYRMSTKCWLWPLTANTERLSRCTRKFVHHVHEHASYSHFHKHILTLERTPTRIMTRMRRRANGGFLELWCKLPYSAPSVLRIAMGSKKELLTGSR